MGRFGWRRSSEVVRESAPDAATLNQRLRDARISGSAADLEQALLASLAVRPDHELSAVELAALQADGSKSRAAIDGLDRFVARTPASPLAWLVLAQLLEDGGQGSRSLLARVEALKHAHALGVWQAPTTTPPHMAANVRHAVRDVLRRRRDVFAAAIEPLRERFGDGALQRTDRALRGYLKEEAITPPDAMQRPRFLYVPELPTSPYLDPSLQPWTPRLREAYAAVREEALAVLQEDAALEGFIEVRDGDRIGNYLGGAKPSWDAFFFYRHGRRYDDNHRRCPRTSALLESIELARIPGQTPEICFSVLAPGTHILPHHGVTNARTVMHLPLCVPPDCALNLVDRGMHHWVEGEPMMFDDTFLHEAWNRSAQPRVILLMDCWNPHLSTVEREAVVALSQAMGVLDVAYKGTPWLDG
jgi:aspartate beta-hydroxylase